MSTQAREASSYRAARRNAAREDHALGNAWRNMYPSDGHAVPSTRQRPGRGFIDRLIKNAQHRASVVLAYADQVRAKLRHMRERSESQRRHAVELEKLKASQT